MAIASVNPMTGEVLKTFEPLSQPAIEEKLQRASTAFPGFQRLAFAERARMMNKAAQALESERDAIARLMTLEMGKLFRAAVEEVNKCAWGCRYYAEHAERFLADEAVETTAVKSYIRYQPIGVILAIMPWNFPFWQVFRFLAPNLMAGNVGVLKHASNVPQCALKIEELLRNVGFPEGVFQTLLISAKQTEGLLGDSRVAAATLTGSEQAGGQIGAVAAKHIKKVVLELGGSDPFIVMPSADLHAAVRTGVKARVLNNGQSCINAKRFIVHQQIAERFEQEFTRTMEGLRLGDPLEETTELGPLASAEAVQTLDGQVRKTVEAGARVLTGGQPANRPGSFYLPTVLTNIPKNSPAYSEELFGPVASLFRARSVDEAISIANDTAFGLGASVWTNDERERRRFVDELQAGLVFINQMVASDPRVPFGGAKRSGVGRELGIYGIREFTNIKTVWIEEAASSAPQAKTASPAE
jgi:succinate-semialdehyde dehydrogenase/glutarate-semialdehyde dehydrogenase